MPKFFLPLVFLSALLLSSPNVPAQATPELSTSKDKPSIYASEPFVVESLQTKVRFESDGTGSRELVTRIRIQSEASLRQFGLLAFSYLHNSESLEIVYVRSRKPGGNVILTPLTDMQDLDSEITRAAPMYTDQREKHVAVKSLSVGDTLEYDVRWIVVHAIAPGNFWLLDNFERGGIVEDEQLEINLSKDRPVKLSSSIAPAIKEEGDRRIYSYRSSHLQREPVDAEEAWEKLLRPTPLPDIQLSSFTSWEEVGKWYAALQRPQVQLTPELRAKAAELTQAKTTDSEKLQAIYDFVSARFRYISISLGAGRYTPHSSSEVFGNQFGDCKDKHTLFAALLEATGIKAYPVLISSSYRPDWAQPSPALFDHLITAIPQGDSFLFLDTTPEVAPFGFLLPQLRDKPALVIPERGPARLLNTPVDPIFPNTQKFEMVASIDEKGTLDGKARLESRGDVELIHRQAFLTTAQNQWQELTQRISGSMGFAGTVSDVSAAKPDATTDPFWLAYSYHRPEFPDWPNHRISVALPFLGLPRLTEKQASSKESLPLGPRGDITFVAKISLPKGYIPFVPPAVDLTRDFAVYTASYAFEHGVLRCTRKLRLLAREISGSDRPAYVSFQKVVEDDESRYIPLLIQSLESEGSPTGFSSTFPPNLVSALSSAHSDNSEAQRLYDAARQSLQLGAPRAAATSLQSAIKLDPKWVDAWLLLGSAHMMASRYEVGVDAIRKAVSLDPSNVRAYRELALALMTAHKNLEAIQAWHDLLKVNPDDNQASAALWPLLLATGNYTEARPLLEKALEADPESPGLHLQLAQAYLRMGREEDSSIQFHKALELDSTANTRNTVAYALADSNRRLHDALQYATQAVEETESQTANVRPESKDASSYGLMAALAAEWDTLGWVKFREGDFEGASKYLESAWLLMQTPVIGDHLGQAFAKLGKKQQAANAFASASSALGPNGDPKLRQSIKSNAASLSDTKDGSNAKQYAAMDLTQLRTYTVPRIKEWGGGYKSAEFTIDLTKGPKVNGVWMLHGAEELEDASDALSELKFRVSFPDDGPTHIIRRGILSCSETSKACTLVLYPVEPPRPATPGVQ
jgi:tetratricopeptide (TPR) repeat protein